MNNSMITRISLIVAAGVLACAPIIGAQSQARNEADGVTITGRVSCSRFGTGSVTPHKGMSVAQTINFCANTNLQGGAYTLVSGNRIYRLIGDSKELAKMSGQTVEVAGRMVPESTDNSAVALMDAVAVTTVVSHKN
jgi:hypothetical protein